MRDTNAGALAGRSKELKALDKAILAFDTDRSHDARMVVKAAFFKWKAVHVGAMKGVEGHKRNAHGLLRALDLEFAESVSSLPPAPATISRIRTVWPKGERPPGWVNVPERLMKDRIDKAFVDAQVVLRSVVGRLERGGSDVQQHVVDWFGKDATGADVLATLKLVRTEFEKLRDAGGSNSLEITIKGADSEFVAAYDPNNKKPNMLFTPYFFSDRYVAPASSLTSRGSPPGQIRTTMLGLVDEYKALAREKEIHELVSSAQLNMPPEASFAATTRKHWDKNKSRADLPFRSGTKYEVVEKELTALGYSLAGSSGEGRTRARAEAERVGGKITALIARIPSTNGEAMYSASGVVIHELTHLYAKTEDVVLAEVGGRTCYGPGMCLYLAHAKPREAKKNADNYRLFVECMQIT